MKALAAVVGCLGLIFGMVAGIAFGGLVVMLLLAALHAFVSSSIPAVGFFGSCAISVALGLLSRVFSRN